MEEGGYWSPGYGLQPLPKTTPGRIPLAPPARGPRPTTGPSPGPPILGPGITAIPMPISPMEPTPVPVPMPVPRGEHPPTAIPVPYVPGGPTTAVPYPAPAPLPVKPAPAQIAAGQEGGIGWLSWLILGILLAMGGLSQVGPGALAGSGAGAMVSGGMGALTGGFGGGPGAGAVPVINRRRGRGIIRL